MRMGRILILFALVILLAIVAVLVRGVEAAQITDPTCGGEWDFKTESPPWGQTSPSIYTWYQVGVKAGTECYKTSSNGVLAGCYEVSGLGTNSFSVSFLGGEGCHDISHVVARKRQDDPTATPQDTATPNPTETTTPTPQDTPAPTETPEDGSTPTVTPTDDPGATPSPTPTDKPPQKKPTPTPPTLLPQTGGGMPNDYWLYGAMLAIGAALIIWGRLRAWRA